MEMVARQSELQEPHVRIIPLLTGGKTAIRPSEYRAHTNLKSFDENGTRILRVHRHAVKGLVKRGRRGVKMGVVGYDHYIVYGMRAAVGAKRPDVEVYDFVINPDMIPDALARVAAHCGIEDLLPKSAE